MSPFCYKMHRNRNSNHSDQNRVVQKSNELARKKKCTRNTMQIMQFAQILENYLDVLFGFFFLCKGFLADQTGNRASIRQNDDSFYNNTTRRRYLPKIRHTRGGGEDLDFALAEVQRQICFAGAKDSVFAPQTPCMNGHF